MENFLIIVLIIFFVVIFVVSFLSCHLLCCRAFYERKETVRRQQLFLAQQAEILNRANLNRPTYAGAHVHPNYLENNPPPSFECAVKLARPEFTEIDLNSEEEKTPNLNSAENKRFSGENSDSEKDKDRESNPPSYDDYLNMTILESMRTYLESSSSSRLNLNVSLNANCDTISISTISDTSASSSDFQCELKDSPPKERY